MNKTIVTHFQKVDSVLFSLIEQVSPVEIKKSDDYFADLCEDIISQQLSGKAGTTIFNRFKALFPHQTITPQVLVKLPDESIRKTGPSWSKVSFLKDLAQKVVDGEIELARLDHLPDQEVIHTLTKVKGIGPWTAEMFLMFSLSREDVFSHGDLGLHKAIKKLYKFKREPTHKQKERLSRPWSPYRTYACCLLWRSLELPQNA